MEVGSFKRKIHFKSLWAYGFDKAISLIKFAFKKSF